MPTKRTQTDPEHRFDAVAESRHWKQIVAAQTEGMSISERMAWFRKQSSVAAIRSQIPVASVAVVLKEDPATYDKDKP